ncbi:hypothetical protein Sulku_1966 [Sulfuricurvum kujiense DSM 16994]|uniref:Uncharacterized protein n=1 Tax=Sulfuricurvum kujiense (strain ATCC BAA-921 / DSM 16994 / JCM 11577 / YK-1) TaxID=709032 RepID=E4U269_SULKY|nr:hypothetical protein [Sulfuricurvum kujiense]ADR34626.1 hypothetical protein Sulku_1966 [Sulfuricurvum kujiense DSM 16994]
MKNLTNIIDFKGIHITEEGLIHLSYGTGDEGVLFHVSMDVSVDGDTTTFGAEDFDIISKDIRKKYSPVEVLKFIKTDLQGYGKLLSQIVLSIASLEEKTGEKIVCMDLLHGIQKFYDMEGNSVATSTNVLDKDEFELYKMLERLFMPS